MPNQLSWGQYRVAVPSFEDVGKDVKETALRLQQFEREKERYEQQRKDMMWKQFLANTDVKSRAFVQQNLQRQQSAILNGTQKRFQQIVSETDGELEWSDIQRARKAQAQAEADIQKRKAWEKNWLEDVETLKEAEPGRWKKDVAKEILEWDGKTPYESSKLGPNAVQPKSATELAQNYANEFKAGNEYTVERSYKANGKYITNEKQFAEEYFDFEGDEVKPNVDSQMKVVKDMVFNVQNKSDWLYNFQRLDDRSRQQYEAKAKDSPYSAVEWFALDKLQPRAFQVSKKQDVRPDSQSQEAGGGGDSDVIRKDYNKDAQKLSDIPRELIEGDSKEAKLYQIADESITFDRNTLRNAFVKQKKGKWKKIEGEEYYDDAKLTGIVEKDGKWYGQVGIRLPEKDKKKDGQQVYEYSDPETQRLYQGTADELAERTGLSKAEVKSNPFVKKAKTSNKVSHALVPVDDNPFIKEFYEIENMPEATGQQQETSEQEEGNTLAGW